jgi:hypothetical protein
MAEQMILESWESDEAQDWESDEAIGESDESTEDIGEAVRRRRNVPAKARGVGGMTLRRPDGGRTNFSFPARLTTTAETNRVVANQTKLDDQLEQFRRALRAQRKSDVSAAGAVTLLLGGGLTIWGLMKASQGGLSLNGWANQGSTEIAAGFSAMQLATTGVKLMMTHHYSRSMLGTGGDLFAAAQLAAFAFGSWYTPSAGTTTSAVITDADLGDEHPDALQNLKPYEFAVTRDSHKMVQAIPDGKLGNTFRYVE